MASRSKPPRRYRRQPKTVSGVNCPAGVAFHSAKAAISRAHRVANTEDGRGYYRCTACGYYHITENSNGDYDRLQAIIAPPRHRPDLAALLGIQHIAEGNQP